MDLLRSLSAFAVAPVCAKSSLRAFAVSEFDPLRREASAFGSWLCQLARLKCLWRNETQPVSEGTASNAALSLSRDLLPQSQHSVFFLAISGLSSVTKEVLAATSVCPASSAPAQKRVLALWLFCPLT